MKGYIHIWPDLGTGIKEVKHYYSKGFEARK